MPAHRIEVIQHGDSSGNDMIVRMTLSSGRHIYGFATKNLYGGDSGHRPDVELPHFTRRQAFSEVHSGNLFNCVKMIESAASAHRISML